MSTSRERCEHIIISDAVYTRYAVQHDKSLRVNGFILFMTYWHKVQMSCRQTQPVVLWHGVRFRHGSLFLHLASGRVNSSSAARALCRIGIVVYVATILVNIFYLPLSCSYLASLEKASPIHTWPAFAFTWTWRHLYKRRWVTWMEMIPDRRCSIWFPSKVHRSSQNEFAECRIIWQVWAGKHNLKETACMTFEVICELADV